MEYELEKMNRLLKGASPRKISIVSRLAGLTIDEILIMRKKWLEDKSDIQICDELGFSSAKLTRKRREAHLKILDTMDLYGLSNLDGLPIPDIIDYDGLFYQAQDALIKFFLHNLHKEDRQKEIVAYLRGLTKEEEREKF